MIERQIESLMPMPLDLVVKKALNSRSARICLVPVRECAQEHQFTREVIARLVNAQPGLDIVVAGSTRDDADLNILCILFGSSWAFGPKFLFNLKRSNTSTHPCQIRKPKLTAWKMP